MKEKNLVNSLFAELCEKLGSVDMVSSWFDFNFTGYYEPEMGAPLYRRMLVFKDLIKQSDLPGIKILTNEMEKKYSEMNKRTVNIDPGYMLLERFVLATGKNFAHRIYIGQGIYADLTLIYQNGSYQVLPWTYPDYADPSMIEYFEVIRKKYMKDLKQEQN